MPNKKLIQKLATLPEQRKARVTGRIPEQCSHQAYSTSLNSQICNVIADPGQGPEQASLVDILVGHFSNNSQNDSSHKGGPCLISIGVSSLVSLDAVELRAGQFARFDGCISEACTAGE